MGAATTARDAQGGQRAGLWARLGIHRDDERALMASAAPVFALASAGAAMSTTTADAMFLSEIGPAHLGEAMVVSSALLAIVLGIVGSLADRLERRRILATLAVVSAVVLAGLAALSFSLPAAAALLTMIVGKQLAAASDLAFWVVIGERLDARRSRRLLPVLAAAGGAGAAIGAVVVKPIADALGAPAVLLCAAGVLALAGAGAMRFAATRRVAPTGSRSAGALIARSWRDGARAVRRQPLARQLAILVAAAGVFASLAYFALGIAVAAQTDLGANKAESAAELAGLLGTIRSGSQILVLVFQLLVAPRLLARIGTGNALLLAPLIALAAGMGLVIAPILAIAIATQVSARVLDSGIEAPAEKLALTLIPTSSRGRIGGFLDGPAKRIGNIAGGAIAAVLAGDPTVFYVVTAVAAGLWLLAAARIARELPTLAISQISAGDDADVEAVVDARAVEALRKELDGPRPERAAELFARLHERGRVDAVPDLVKAATTRGGPALWRALIGTLDEPAEAHGPALAAAAKTCADTELAVRAVGLAGGVSTDELAAWLAAQDAALALTAEIAKLRLAGDHAGALERMSDAVRDSGPTGRVATEELGVEIARALATSSIDGERVFEATRHLARALRRGRGDVASRAAGFTALARVVAWAREQRNAELALLRADLLELARERVEAGATPIAPETALTSLMRSPATKTDDAIEVAASIRLMGALLEGADAVEPDDLRRVARALGEPDDDVRAAAEDALTALGPAAAGELMATAAWGRRRARDRAAALLAELPVTPAAIDRLIDAELDSLDATHAAISVLREPGDELLARRLDERMREIAHTVLLLVAARRRSPSIARAAAAWGHARGALERARTLAVVEAALPRSLVVRLVDAVDDLSPADRAAALERAGGTPPSRDVIVRTELAGRDRLARALALHIIGAAGRSAHRDTIAGAAHAEVQAATAADLLRRVTDAIARDPDHVPEDDGGTDMPTRVESLIALGRVPLLAALTTRQLADVAERARWVTARPGSVVVTSGDSIDALILVEDGELALGERRIVKGEVVDELACVAPANVTHDLKAVRATRMLRLERVDFEELVDDVPGLAASVCRALGERARRAEEANYKSPLSSRV